MQIADALAKMGGFRSIAQQLGITEAQVNSGAEALIPAIMNSLKRQAPAQSAGLGGLTGLLGQLGNSGLMDKALGSVSGQQGQEGLGEQLLGQLFGSREESATIAQQAAAKTGLDPDILKKMLPMLAALMAGWLAKQNTGSGAADAPAAGTDALGGVMQLAGKFLR